MSHLGGIRIQTLVSRAAAAGNYLVHTFGASYLTSKILFSDFADWVLQTYAGFIQDSLGAIADTVQGVLRRRRSVFDYMTAAQRTSVIAGDFVEDVTVSLQTAITRNITLSGGQLDWPDGGYKISDELLIPQSTGWVMQGASRKGVRIVQYTSNKRIFRFTAADTSRFELSDLSLEYAVQQLTASSQSVAISFMCDTGSAGNGFYNFQLKRLNFVNCYRCIAHDDSNDAAVWGFVVDEIYVAETCTGSVFYGAGSPTQGNPNAYFGSVYVLANAIDASEIIFNFNGYVNAVMESIEVNSVSNGAQVLKNNGPGTITIGSLAIEGGTWSTNSRKIINNPGGRILLGSLRLATVTMAAGTTTNGVTLLGYDGGTSGYYHVGSVLVTSVTMSSGNFYIADGASTSGVPTRRTEIDYLLVADLATSGIYLTELTATTSANGVKVNTWAEPRVSSDVGDADYTYAFGDCSIVRYDTTLTANRTVTIPSISAGAQGNVYNGLTLTIYRQGLGDFRLDITPSGGSTIVSFPPNTKGSLILTWYRHGWKVVSRYLQDAVGADVGDLAKTLTVGQASQTQVWNTPIAADRAVTLSTTGAVNGDNWRIVRTAAATGAFNLNVGTGPLKALAAGEWCDVKYDGAAWMLTAFGSL